MKPFLNLGAGRIILPGERPNHHRLVDESIYRYPHWHNVDRNNEPGIDQCVDLFTYPWPFEDNQFAGALASHLVEHIPHEIRVDRGEFRYFETEPMDNGLEQIKPVNVAGNKTITVALDIEKTKRADELARLQDGWYAFFAELYRVLEHGAIVHILSPYAWSQGAMSDPTHTRYLTEHTFTHSMQPDPNSPFKYETGGINFEMVQNAHFNVTEMFGHLAIQPGDNEAMIARKQVQFQEALMTRINVVYELYVKLRAVKE